MEDNKLIKQKFKIQLCIIQVKKFLDDSKQVVNEKKKRRKLN